MPEQDRPTAESVEQAIRQLAAGDPQTAVVDLTAVANRAIIELHKIAREQSSQRRGAPEWGIWAKLANAARGSVLQVATVRDSLKAFRSQASSGSRESATSVEAGRAEGTVEDGG